MPPSDNFVRGKARKVVARPEPPQRDRRTKRERDRSSRARNAILRSQQEG